MSCVGASSCPGAAGAWSAFAADDIGHRHTADVVFLELRLFWETGFRGLRKTLRFMLRAVMGGERAAGAQKIGGFGSPFDAAERLRTL